MHASHLRLLRTGKKNGAGQEGGQRRARLAANGALQLRRLKNKEDAPPPPPPKKKWWELEAEALATLGNGEDPEEFPGQQIFVGRSVDEDYKHLTLNDLGASLWSATDHGES